MKSIDILVDYLGSAKQVPALIDGIQAYEPKAKINVAYSLKDKHNDYTFLEKDLKDYKNVSFKEDDLSPESVRVRLDTLYNHTTLMNHDNIALHIDPLKFSKQKLLSENEIANLKDFYGVKDSHKVITAGSTAMEEFPLVVASLMKTMDYNPNTKAIIAPRWYPEELMDTLKAEGIPFTTDQNIDKDSNLVVITKEGTLADIYSFTDKTIIGDTFISDGGGQNPIEPAVYQNQIISGKFNKNNEFAYNVLEASGLMKRIEGSDLTKELQRDLSKDELKKAKENAEKVFTFMKNSNLTYGEIIARMANGSITREQAKGLLNQYGSTYSDDMDVPIPK